MLKSFKNKELAALWNGKRSKIDSRMHGRIVLRLDAVDSAATLNDLNVPGFNFHSLQGHNPTRYTIHVNGPWCITFEFSDGDAHRVDFEQYH